MKRKYIFAGLALVSFMSGCYTAPRIHPRDLAGYYPDRLEHGEEIRKRYTNVSIESDFYLEP